MADWPMSGAPQGTFVVSSFDILSGGYVNVSNLSPTAAWASANLALYIPIRVTVTCTLLKLMVFNGSSVAGNVDVGLYDVAGTRLVSSGSTAQSGTSAFQTFDVTDTELAPGVFYLALAASSTSANFTGSVSFTAQLTRALGMFQQASALPLPATATFASNTTTGCLPWVGMTLQARV